MQYPLQKELPIIGKNWNIVESDYMNKSLFISIVSMNKSLFISIVSLVYFIFTAAITALFHLIPNWSYIWGFIMGFLMFIISMVVGLAGRKHFSMNIVSLALSGISLSIFTYMWCMYKEIKPSILMLLGNAGLASLFCFIYYLLMFVPLFKKNNKKMAILFTLIGIVGVIVFLVNGNLAYFSVFGLYLVLAMSFIWAGISSDEDIETTMMYLSFAGFCVLIVGIIVLIVIAGEGDLDFPDIYITGGNKKGKKSR
jgi:drug/metabolite transporter (DMT)-like permease